MCQLTAYIEGHTFYLLLSTEPVAFVEQRMSTEVNPPNIRMHIYRFYSNLMADWYGPSLLQHRLSCPLEFERNFSRSHSLCCPNVKLNQVPLTVFPISILRLHQLNVDVLVYAYFYLIEAQFHVLI